MSDQKILCDGRVINYEDDPIAYNTLRTMVDFYIDHKVDESLYRSPRMRMYYALDSDLQLHCSPMQELVSQVVNQSEDQVVMTISTYNKLMEPYIFCSKPRLDCDAREKGTCSPSCEYYSGQKRFLNPNSDII